MLGLNEGRAALARLASAQGGPIETCSSVPHFGGPPGLQAGTTGATAAARPCCPAVGPWPGPPASRPHSAGPLLTTLVFSPGCPHPPRPGSRPPLPGGPPCCFPARLWVISHLPPFRILLPALPGYAACGSFHSAPGWSRSCPLLLGSSFLSSLRAAAEWPNGEAQGPGACVQPSRGPTGSRCCGPQSCLHR